ncbi:hypothetical protein [Streptomyces agglomeratus]|uniref:hypothetical protein n=1 Tax=Streptomyces agglomeratus TaxID=285458 RepID=UPI00086F1485|nr:hypothetical protein [Streptomyces agglomeratus]OEJ55170.1 hypothetical protein BGK72_34705 [Streptomyces agglomeratus]
MIRTTDGYEMDVNEACVAANRYPPGQFFELLAELADRLGASLPPTGRPVILREEKDRAHFPAEVGKDAAVVAMTSSDLERYLCGS